MSLIVMIIGFAIVVAAVVGMINLNYLGRALNYVLVNRKVRTAAIARIACGAFLVLASPFCSFIGGAFLIGAMAIVSGIFVMMLGDEKAESFITAVLTFPPTLQRVALIFPLIFGLLIVYSA